MIYSLLACSFVAVAWAKSAFVEPQSVTQATVTFNSNTNSFDVTEGSASDSGDAYGSYYLNYNGSGWNYFDGYAQSEVDSPEDHLLYSKALGFLEGYITCDTIHTFYPNFYSGSFGTNKPGPKTIAFLQANYDWQKAQAAANPTDDYWHSVDATLHQLEGLYEGYAAGCASNTAAPDVPDYSSMTHPTLMHFLLMNAWGDLYQITAKFFEPGIAQSPHRHIERCSSIVKLLPDYSDVVFGHATWDTFESSGPRILKHYSFPLLRSSFAEHHYDTHFSSSPGLLSSVDDFFLVSGYAKLAVQETTNNLYNVSLLQEIVPNTVLSYMRAILANQLATSGADWATVFDRYHSGTYTNQWMVMDWALFTPGASPKPGFFTVYEEVPTFSQYEDQTEALIRDGYWGSYNVPFYPKVAEMSGYARLCQRMDDYCYEKAPRALLFREYQENIVDIASGQWIMGYNNFQYDAASKNDSCNAIACRGDLEPNESSRGAYGAIDAKVTSGSAARFNNGFAPMYMARVGPSYDGQVDFCWSNVADEETYSHAGQPDCYHYPWQMFPPV